MVRWYRTTILSGTTTLEVPVPEYQGPVEKTPYLVFYICAIGRRTFSPYRNT